MSVTATKVNTAVVVCLHARDYRAGERRRRNICDDVFCTFPTAAQSAARPKAEAGNTGHIGAPMPGVVATVAAVAGKPVKAGDLLLTIEAMKMETGIHADRDAVVKAVHVQAGSQIDAKDLLVELE